MCFLTGWSQCVYGTGWSRSLARDKDLLMGFVHLEVILTLTSLEVVAPNY